MMNYIDCEANIYIDLNTAVHLNVVFWVITFDSVNPPMRLLSL